MSPRVYASSRDRILDAAERLLLRTGGTGPISVEAIAGEAKVSKGGFFHHFESKDALLLAILERLVADVKTQIERAAEGDPEPRGARLRAQIALTFDMGEAGYERMVALLLAFLQAAGAQPAVVRRARQINAEVLERDEAEDIPLGRAMAIQFALDGYALAVGLGSTALTPKQKAAFRDSLMALARPEARPPVHGRKKP